jgi:hypothetical protein
MLLIMVKIIIIKFGPYCLKIIVMIASLNKHSRALSCLLRSLTLPHALRLPYLDAASAPTRCLQARRARHVPLRPTRSRTWLRMWSCLCLVFKPVVSPPWLLSLQLCLCLPLFNFDLSPDYSRTAPTESTLSLSPSLTNIDEFENHCDDQDYLKHNSYFLLFYKSELLTSCSVYNFWNPS